MKHAPTILLYTHFSTHTIPSPSIHHLPSLVPSLSTRVVFTLFAVFRTASDIKTGVEILGMRLHHPSLIPAPLTTHPSLTLQSHHPRHSPSLHPPLTHTTSPLLTHQHHPHHPPIPHPLVTHHHPHHPPIPHPPLTHHHPPTRQLTRCRMPLIM